MHQHWSTIKKLIWLNANLANGSVLETVTGISPLLLANAIAGNMVSLKQIGKCVQALNPTPDNPIDIMCNNGTLRMVDDELPDGYRRIESIGFDGDFHYITNEKLRGSDEITITLDDTRSSGQNVFGSYSGTSSGTKNYSLYVYGAGSTSYSYLRYGETLYRPRYGSGKRTLVYGPNGTSGFLTDLSMEPDEFETDDVAWIGMLPNSSSPHFTGTIVGSILIGDRLKYIPCERVSDGAVGYYEPNTSVFLEPVGEGTPTKGAYDGSHYQLGVVGTPETVTSGMQTASVQDLYAVGDYVDTQDIVSGVVTRRVSVYVFDGTENWELPGGADYFRLDGMFTDTVPYSSSNPAVVCSHFVGRQSKTSASGMNDGDIKLGYTSSANRLYLKYAAMADADALKAYLAEQYAAGTPVIIIYPIENEITERTAAQTLTLADGNNTITVTAEIGGIELEAQYHATS